MNNSQTLGDNYQTILKSFQDKPERQIISSYLYFQTHLLSNNKHQISFLSFYNFMNLPYELSLRLFKVIQTSTRKTDFMSKDDFILGLSAIYSNTDINLKLSLAFSFLTFDCYNKTIIKKDLKIILMLFHFIDNEEMTLYEINEILDLFFENDAEQLSLEQFESKCKKDSTIPLLIVFYLDHYQPFTNETINFFIENVYNNNTSVQLMGIAQQIQHEYSIVWNNHETSFGIPHYYLFQYLYYNFHIQNLIIEEGIDDLETFEQSIHEMKDKMIERKMLNPKEQKSSHNLKSYFFDEPILRQFSNYTNQFDKSKTITTDLSSQLVLNSRLRITKGITINSSTHFESSGKNRTRKYNNTVDYTSRLKRNKTIITDGTNAGENLSTFKHNKTIYTDNSISTVENKMITNNTTISEGSFCLLKYGNTISTIDKCLLFSEFEFYVILKKKNTSTNQMNINKSSSCHSNISESAEDVFQFSKNKMYIKGEDLYVFRYDKSSSKFFFKQIISLKHFYVEEGTEEEQIFDVESKTIYYSIHLISTVQNKIQVNVIFVKDKSLVNRFILSVQRVTKFKTINDNYELINLLGKGTSGIVMKAINKRNNFVVAIKIIEKNYTNKEQIRQIRREVDITKYVGKLNKSKLIKILETIENNNTIYIVEEFSNGNNLEVFIKKKLPFLDMELRNKLLLSIIEQLFLALAELKKIGVLHLDLKAENVLLNVSGVDDLSIKVIDFGTAKIKLSTNHFFGSFGTMMYLAPEIIKKQEYTEKADIWALGVLIYYLVHEKLPFKITEIKEMEQQILNSTININKDLGFQLDDCNKINQILLASLNRNPKVRSNVEQLIEIFSGT